MDGLYDPSLKLVLKLKGLFLVVLKWKTSQRVDAVEFPVLDEDGRKRLREFWIGVEFEF